MLRPAILVPLFGLVLVSFAFFSPKHDVLCVSVVKLGKWTSLANNCDSRNIAREADMLDQFLTENTASRTRPVYVFSVAATAHVLAPVLVPAAMLLQGTLAMAKPRVTIFIAAVALNFLLLLQAHAWLVRLIGHDDFATRLALMGTLATSDIAVAWFWVPHQIFMNLLVPIGGVYLFCQGARSELLPARRLFAGGLFTAAGCLWYGYCLIWPVAFGLGALWGLHDYNRAALIEQARRLLIYGSGVVAPLAVWFGGYWFSGLEVAYEAQSVGQFQWLSEALRAHRLGAALLEHGIAMARVAGGYLGLHGLLAGIAMLVCLALAGRAGGWRRSLGDAVPVGAVATLLLMLAFNYLQGYHQARLLLFPIALATLVGFRLLQLAGRGGLIAPAGFALAAVQLTLALARPAISYE